MQTNYLHMVMLGCTPKGRLTEQHDIFFGIGPHLKNLVPDMKNFWPEANGIMHIDCWRTITNVNGYAIEIKSKTEYKKQGPNLKLFFINLGGYKQNEFEEYHYKVLVVATSKSQAIKEAKQTTFYEHTGFKGAESHIDDKYGIDVDDIFEIDDVLSPELKLNYFIHISAQPNNTKQDTLHIGYLKLAKLEK
jgi:Domain of Unknown Function (DUF1543)